MFRGVPMLVNRVASFASTIGNGLSRALLPPTCCLCGRLAPAFLAGAEPDLDLCEVCLNLFPLDGAPNADVNADVNADASPPASFARTLVRTRVSFQYAYPVDHMIRALKFRGERVYARVLGTLLAQQVRALRQPAPHRIVPIPLHAERYRERGFNQAQEIARFAAKGLSIPLDTRCLERTVATLEQSGLTLAQRRRNVRDAFFVRRVPHVQRVALVDDVLTTGSTALAAAKALLDAGVPEVELWAVARVTLD